MMESSETKNISTTTEQMDRLFDAFDAPEPVPTSHSLFVGAFFGSYSVEDSSIDEKSQYISFEKSTDRDYSPGDETLLDISKFTPQENSLDLPPKKSPTEETARVTPDLDADDKDEPRFILRHISTESKNNISSDDEVVRLSQSASKQPESPFIAKEARSGYGVIIDGSPEKPSTMKESVSFFENNESSHSSRAKTVQTSNIFDYGLDDASDKDTQRNRCPSPTKKKETKGSNFDDTEEGRGQNAFRDDECWNSQANALGQASCKSSRNKHASDHSNAHPDDASIGSREAASVKSRCVSTSSKTSKKAKSKKKERRSSRSGSVSSRSVDPSIDSKSVRSSKSKKERRNSHGGSSSSRSSKSKKDGKSTRSSKREKRAIGEESSESESVHSRSRTKDRLSLTDNFRSNERRYDELSTDSVRDHYETLYRSYTLLGTPDSKISEGSCESEKALADSSNNYQLEDENVKKRLVLSEVTPSKHSEGIRYQNGYRGKKHSSVEDKAVDDLGFFLASPIEKSDEVCRIRDETPRDSSGEVDRFISMEEGLHQLENIDDTRLDMEEREDNAVPEDATSCSYTDASSLPGGAQFSIATQARKELGLGTSSLAGTSTETKSRKQKNTKSVTSKRSKRESGQKSQRLCKIDASDCGSNSSHPNEKANLSSSFIKVAHDYIYPSSRRDFILGSVVCVFLILLVIILPITLTSKEERNSQQNVTIVPTPPPTQSPVAQSSGSKPRYVYSHEAVWRDGNTGFGSSLAYDNDILLVGMPTVGTIRTFAVERGRVELLGTVQGSQSGSGFGWSLDVASSSFIAAGAPFLHAFGSTRSVGGAYVFEYEVSSGTWRQFGPVIRGDEDTFAERENFGTSIGVTLLEDRVRVAVGAPRSSIQYLYDVGRLYTYERSLTRGGNWDRIETNALYGLKTGDRFGSSVQLSSDGSTLIAGAPGSLLHEDPGYVLGYQYSESEKWKPIFTLNGMHANEEFGASVAILSENGDTIAIGAPAFNENSGRVSIYQLNLDGRYEQLGSDIVGSFGERIGDKNSLDGSKSENGMSVLVATATGIIKRYEYVEDRGEWMQLYETLDTKFNGVSSLACAGKDCHSLAAGSLPDRAVSLFESSVLGDRY